MKFLGRLLALLVITVACQAQIVNNGGGGSGVTFVTSDPAGACANQATGQFNYLSGNLWNCVASAWTQTNPSAGTGAPAGGNGTLQFNSSSVFGGISSWSTNGTTTITGNSSGILNLGSLPVLTGLVLPKAAGAAPIIAGNLAYNTTINALVVGLGSSTTGVQAIAATGTTLATTCTNQVLTAISGGAAPTCSSLTSSFLPLSSMGTITGGTWNGSVVGGTYGGTGVNNGSSTITVSGNLTTTGAFNPTFAIPSSSTWTFPSGGGTLVNTGVTTLSSLVSVGTITTGVWNGTRLTSSYVPTDTVYNDQANTFSTGLQDLAAATLRIPTGAGATASSSSTLIRDTTAQNVHIYANSADAIVGAITGSPANNDCAKFVISGSNITVTTAGAACGSGGGSLTTGPTGALNITGTVIDVVTAVVPLVSSHNVMTGYNDFSGGFIRLPESTVASLPSASTNTGKEYVVTDGASSSDCTVGSSTTVVNMCRSDGTNWVFIGGSGGGGGSGTVNAGTATHLGYYASSTNVISDMGADFTFATHTLTGGASAVLDLSAAAATGLKIPAGAGFAPTVDGQIALNSSTHALAFGSNGTALVAAVAATGTGTSTSCTNQAMTAISAIATPSCTTITSAFTDTSIAHTGVDISTSYHVTAINGTAFPTSTGLIGSNSSAQPVAATAAAVSAVNYAVGGGSANAQTAAYSPAITALVDGLSVCWLPIAANTNTAPAFSPNGLTARTIVTAHNGGLAINDLTTTAVACAVYNLGATHWELQNPQTNPSFANAALSNLTGPTSINQQLSFQAANNVGSAANPPQDLFFYGSGTYGSTSFEFAGTPTANRVITIQDAAYTVAGTNLAQSFSAVQTFPGGDFNCGGVNAQSGTTYTVLAADACKLTTYSNASSVAVTLPHATGAGFTAGFYFFQFNQGAGAVTITPTTSTINGGSTVTLNQNQGALIMSDGTNYSAWISSAPSGSGTVTSFTVAGTSNQISVSGTCTVTTSGTCTLSLSPTVVLGTDNSVAGSVQLANSAANAHTIWASGATTSNTIAGFATAPTTGDLVSCTTASTTCTLTDAGFLATNVVRKDTTNSGAAAMTLDMSASTAASAFKLPVGAGLTVAVNGALGYDSTNNMLHGAQSSADAKIPQFTVTPTNGHCATWVVSGSNYKLGDASCTSASLSTITAAVASNTIANGNNPQVWNWAQTSAGQVAMTFGETTAATSTGTPYEVQIATLAGSTATPLNIVSSLTGSQTLPSLSITPTWNTSGVVDAALLINVTNTASGAASLLFDAQVGGTSQFKVDKSGNATAAGSFTAGATGGVGGSVSLPEGTAASASSGNDVCYGDSTLHGVKCSWNNGSFLPLPLLNGTLTAGGLSYHDSTTNLLDSSADWTVVSHTLTGGASSIADLSAATGTAAFKVPSHTSNTATAAGVLDYDTTSSNYHGNNGADGIFPLFASAPTTGNVVSATVSAGKVSLSDAGFLATNVVRKDTTNTGGASMTLDMGSSTSLTVPKSAGAVPSADGQIADNTTNHTLVWGSNGTTIVGAAATTGTGTATTCTNQVITAVSSLAAPTCTALTGAFLPSPSASTLGGIESIVSASHNWIDSISTLGVPHQSQPTFADLATGTVAALATFPGGDFFMGGVDVQSGTSYAFVTGDENKLVTFNNAAAVAVTLSQATTTGFTAGAVFYAFNRGAGTATITPATSTINGAATLVLTQNQGTMIVSDGTNYSAWVSASGGGGTGCIPSGSSGYVLTDNGATGCTSNSTFTFASGTATLGTDNSLAGAVQLANGSANAHTIWSSGATTSNTIAGFATAPTTGDLVSCTTASTTCTLTDSGVLAAHVVTSAASLAANVPAYGAGSQGLVSGLATGSAGTITSGKLACVTSSNTMGNCTATPPNNFLGVFNSSTTYATSGIISVSLDATQNVTFGDILCASATSAGNAHDNGSTACTTGEWVGVVTTTASSVSSATTSLKLQ